MFFYKKSMNWRGGKGVDEICLKIYCKKLDKGVLNFVNLHNYCIIAIIVHCCD